MKTKESVLQRVQEAGTYASFIVAIVSPLAAVLGFSLNRELFYALVALILIPIVYLIYQYKVAVRKIEEEGVVQRPQWLWRLLTHRVVPRPQELIKGTVMVVAPPKVREQAGILESIHNQKDQFNLIFHYLPLPDSRTGKIDEDLGESKLNQLQSLNTFNKQLESCAGVVLLDDCDWIRYEEIYPRSWQIINDWSNKYTYRPIMSVRIGGGGTLNKYSWSNLNESIGNNQALLSNLLAQSTNRSKDWYDHATALGRLSLILALLLFIAFFVSIFLIYRVKNRMDQLNKLTTAMTITPEEQVKLTEHFASYRSSQVSLVDNNKQLLRGIAGHLRSKIIRSSGVASDIDVILFALNKETSYIDEVVATREPLRDFDFPYSLTEVHSKSIVGCAIARRSVVYWIGLDQSGTGTKDIWLWDQNGQRIGAFDGKQWKHDGQTCELGPPPKSAEDNSSKPDDPRQYLLCAPVGISADLSISPVGAICISSRADLMLNESWAHQLILHYGNLLSFFNWESVLQKAPKAQAVSHP